MRANLKLKKRRRFAVLFSVIILSNVCCLAGCACISAFATARTAIIAVPIIAVAVLGADIPLIMLLLNRMGIG